MKKHDWSKLPVQELEKEVARHNELYFAKRVPEISDYEFDRLVEELKKRRPGSPVLLELVSDASATGAKVRHAVPMLSLDKCYDDETLADWATKFKGDVMATPKIDGCAVSLKYNKQGLLYLAATRGDGMEGEEITANARTVRAIPSKIHLGDVEVRGEVYMALSVFKKYREQFANPRNLAAGAIKQKDPKKTREYSISFFAYDILGANLKTEEEKMGALTQNGFEVVEWKKVSHSKLKAAYEVFLDKRDKYDFETDGVVFKANLVDEQRRLGITAHHPRYGIAYKFQGDSGVTKLLDIEWSVARTGVITPVAIVEPVELSGALVRRASLHNIGILKQLGVAKGARVLMMRRGGVIPNLESVTEKGEGKIEVPKKCPSCGASTQEKDDFLYCTNPEACVRSKIGELIHFVKTIGIDGFGNKLIVRLYEEGLVTEPSEFFELTKDDLLTIERMGDKLVAKLIGNVAASRKMPLGVFLQSLGIRELGRHMAGILERFASLNKVLELNEEELSNIHGVGPVIAREAVNGLKSKRKIIDKLLKYVKVEKGRVNAGEGPLKGASFLFTGTLDSMDRGGAQRLVEELGGAAASGVSAKLSYLVVGDGGHAGSKLDKAKKLISDGANLKIISEKEFLKLIGD